MVQYLNSLKAYQDEVTLIQDQFRSQLELYEAQADVFKAQMEDYQKARLSYEAARNSAVATAEGIIESVKKEFGWAFVNKDDPDVFWSWIATLWLAQLILIGVYFVLILFLIKRKDG